MVNFKAHCLPQHHFNYMYVVGTGPINDMNHQKYLKTQDLFVKKHKDSKCTLKLE